MGAHPYDGTIGFDLPPGYWDIEVKFVDTRVRIAGMLLSLGTFVGLAGLYIWGLWRHTTVT
jgi:hypothetical protein